MSGTRPRDKIRREKQVEDYLMILFDKILAFFKKAEEQPHPLPTCEEHKAILAFEKDLDFFLHEDDFKSRKEYQYLCDKHHPYPYYKQFSKTQ